MTIHSVRRVLVVGDVGDDDPGFVGQRLRDGGAELVPLDRDALPPRADDGAELLVLLGSARCGHAAEQSAAVETESAFVRDALDLGVPVLGICYGAQLLAHALGGSITASPRPEVGYFTVESDDEVLCPPGPWAQMHSDAFELPPTAVALGRTASGVQAFVDESRAARALGWQFHPEVTAEEYARWVSSLEDYCRTHGADPDVLRREAYERESDLRARAYALTDAAVDWLAGRPAGR